MIGSDFLLEGAKVGQSWPGTRRMPPLESDLCKDRPASSRFVVMIYWYICREQPEATSWNEWSGL